MATSSRHLRVGVARAPGDYRLLRQSAKAFHWRIVMFWALIIFVVIFPKSGVKAGAIPLTTGYALLCAAAAIAFVDNLLQARSSLPGLLALGMCGPFGGFVALSLLVNGAIDQGSAVAAITSFVALPSIFLALFAAQIKLVPWPTIKRSIVLSVRVLALYGVILFIMKLTTGTFLEIPYLTVNADDAGLLETTKAIDRGGVFKLISSYNNGNLFGASMMLLLPLYLWLDRSRIFKGIVITALILTLSRSVWLALIVSWTLTTLQGQLTARRLVALACGVFALCFSVLWVAIWISNGLGFVTDPTFGGRNSTLAEVTNIVLLPSLPVEMLPEIVYAGVVRLFGALGLLAFLMFLFGPIAVAKLQYGRLLPVQTHAALGILSYAAICCADGGIMLIPVIPLFLFTSLILLEAPHLKVAARDCPKLLGWTPTRLRVSELAC